MSKKILNKIARLEKIQDKFNKLMDEISEDINEITDFEYEVVLTWVQGDNFVLLVPDTGDNAQVNAIYGKSKKNKLTINDLERHAL